MWINMLSKLAEKCKLHRASSIEECSFPIEESSFLNQFTVPKRAAVFELVVQHGRVELVPVEYKLVIHLSLKITTLTPNFD